MTSIVTYETLKLNLIPIHKKIQNKTKQYFNYTAIILDTLIII